MKKLLSSLLILLMILSLCACQPVFDTSVPTPKDYALTKDQKLLVHFIDVGQGDCTLLESEGEFVLIDAGEKTAADTVCKYLRCRNLKTLKYVIATHPHSDHVGGLTQVLKTFKTENFITCETDQSTNTWLDVLRTVDKKNINYIDAEPGDTYSFGEGSFEILAPLGSGYSGYNNYSVVIKAVCGDISFMLTGDAETESENEMLRSKADLSADVLKCGHHGSSTSTSDAFLRAVSPHFAVISCGEDNEYGHPHKETLSKLKKYSIEYYRTDKMGTIIAATDGEGLSFYEASGQKIESTLSSESTEEAPSEYIGNKNSRVFHRPDCGGVKTMSEKNKVIFTTREEALDKGYSPCKQCNP